MYLAFLFLHECHHLPGNALFKTFKIQGKTFTLTTVKVSVPLMNTKSSHLHYILKLWREKTVAW